jgi:hypothetical protein
MDTMASNWSLGTGAWSYYQATSGLDVPESDTLVGLGRQMAYGKARVTKVPFKTVWLLEVGDVITK